MPEMTELLRGEITREWIALLQTQGQTLNMEVTTFSTALFGYVIAAYFAGKNLPPKLMVIFTTLYVVVMTLTIGNLFGNGLTVVGLHAALLNVCPECGINPFISIEAVILGLVVNISMLIASLYFMWSVRHPKSN